jgi:hypothetical protein
MATKLVNGERVELTQAELDAFNASRTPTLDEAKLTRIEELREERNAGIAQGHDYTFTDSSTATIPMAVPNDATRMQAVALYAKQLVDDGDGSTVVEFEDATGADFAQPASEVWNASKSAGAKAQDWHSKFVQHKTNVKALTTVADVRSYDPEASGNPGWPS